MFILIATNTNSVPVQAGIGELLSLENARSVVRLEPVRVAREVSTRAHGQDRVLDATADQVFPEKAGEQLQSNADSAFLSQEADGMSRNITIPKNAIIAGVVGVGGMFFVYSLIYAALLSRLE